MTCLHNHDQILEFLRKIFLKDFQIYQNYLCALTFIKQSDIFFSYNKSTDLNNATNVLVLRSHNGYVALTRIYSIRIFENVTQHYRYA